MSFKEVTRKGMVFMDYQALYDEWLTSPCFDEATKAELRGISEEEKKDRFYTAGVWYSRSSWSDRSWIKPHEYLYSP